MLLFYLFVLLLCLVICGVFIIFFAAQVAAIFTTDAPFVPVPDETLEKIIENLQLQKDSVLYDLGCGDGRILKLAAEKYPTRKAVGVEIAFLPYFLARWRTRKYKNVEIRRENIFNADVHDATHIFVYLFPEVLEKLLTILQEKCGAGTRIVSCDFEDKYRRPTEIIPLNTLAKRGKRLVIYTL